MHVVEFLKQELSSVPNVSFSCRYGWRHIIVHYYKCLCVSELIRDPLRRLARTVVRSTTVRLWMYGLGGLRHYVRTGMVTWIT
jgi:hypothetical protein